MVNSEDRRVRRSKKAMVDALAGLLQEKPLNHITVREIAERADINRGTFYLHYKDVYDMAEQLQNEILERFNEIVTDFMPKSDSDTLFPMLEKLFELLKENAQLAKSLMGRNGDAAFVYKLRQAMHDKCLENLPNLISAQENPAVRYYYRYIESGCVGLCSDWLNGGNETPQEMAKLFESFILNGARTFLSKDDPRLQTDNR